MGFKSFLHRVNTIANEHTNVNIKTGILIENKSLNGNILFNGFLMDFNGNIIKKHRYKNLGIYYRNYYLAQNKYEGYKWGLFDKNTDKPVWIKSQPIHHEILVSSRETIFVFSKETKEYKGRNMDFDVILEYDFEGKLLDRFSMFDDLESFQKYHKRFSFDIPKLPFSSERSKRHKKSPWGGYYDYYRLNSMQLLQKTSLGKQDKRFQEGNWLISCRHGSLIFILDKDTKEIVYSLHQHSIPTQLQGQHGVQFLDNGNFLIFDNGRYRYQSRVIELNPITLEIEFEYTSKDFYTESQGYVQKIESNYLITESEKGRIFMVDSQGLILWDYITTELQHGKNSNYPKNYGKPQWIYRALYIK